MQSGSREVGQAVLRAVKWMICEIRNGLINVFCISRGHIFQLRDHNDGYDGTKEKKEEKEGYRYRKRGGKKERKRRRYR